MKKSAFAASIAAAFGMATFTSTTSAAISTNVDCFVEYIESTGSQWIDTGVCGKSTVNMALDVMVLSSKGSSCLIGERSSTSSESNKKLVFWMQNTGKPALNCGSLDSGWLSGNILNVRHVISNENARLFLDGTRIYNGSAQTFSSSLTMTMFFLRTSATALDKASNRPVNARIYGLKIYDAGVLVRNFKPCQVTITDPDAGTSETMHGLWDNVAGLFYGDRSGGADFNSGPALAFSIGPATFSRHRLAATITAEMISLGANASAQASLWIGTSSDPATFTQLGNAITVTDTTSFTIAENLPAFDTAYWWQLRATGSDDNATVATTVQSVLAPSVVAYTGATGGDWHTASNWETGAIPTIDDAVSIVGKWVRATNSITAKSIYVKGAGLVVGGTTLSVDGVKAQTPFNATSAVPYSITLSGDLVLDGASLSLGARREAANVSASIGGDFVITNGAVAAIYAGKTDGLTFDDMDASAALLYANANIIAVGGELRVGAGSYLYAENEGLTGTPVFFKPGDFKLEAGGTVSATSRGWGKYKFVSGDVFPVGAISDTASSSFYTYAFSPGITYECGASYGALSGAAPKNRSVKKITAADGTKVSATYTGSTYGSAYAPFLPGSPNGAHNDNAGNTVRGGGSVCVLASGSVAVDGAITATGTGASYGGASGGSIWLSGSELHIGRSASMSADGGKSNYSSSGGAGRIALTAGASQPQLDALAAGGAPTAFTTCDLYGFKHTVLGGIKNSGTTRSASGTAKLVFAPTSCLAVEVRAVPEELTVATPAYGFHVLAKSPLPSFTLSAQSTYPDYYRDLRRYAVQGYVVSNTVGEVSGSLSAETDPLTLTWQWTAIEDCVRIRPVGGGSITVNGTSYATDTNVWFATGTPLGLSATPGTGDFSAWYGDFGTGQSTDATLALSAHPGLTVWGVFSDAATVAKSYSGADNGFWDVASNWTPAGVPTPMDEVTISSKQVKSYGLAAAKNLTLSAGKLAVGGASAATTTAQTAPADAFVKGSGIIVVSNLSATGASAISIGARRQKADLLCASIGGGLSLADSSTLAVYAPAYDGPLNASGMIPLTNCYHSAFQMTVGGGFSLDGTAVVYPEADLVTGNPVRFDVGGDVTVGASASFNATTRGFGWVNGVSENYIDPRKRTTSGSYYTLAPGYGNTYTHGGAYGGGNASAPKMKYGYAYAPYLPGSPNGIYSTIYRGGGTVWIKTPGTIYLDGKIYANGDGASGSISCSSGGGIWLVAQKVECGQSARLQANATGAGWGSNAPGTGGRISISLGVSDEDLAALAQGAAPENLSYSDSITIVTATANGGTYGSGSSAVTSPAGTLTTVTGEVDTYPLEVRSVPVAVVADGLDYETASVEKGRAWSATVASLGYDPAYPGTVRYTCCGWVVSNSTEQVAAGNGTTATFTPETGPFSITWLWTDRETAGAVFSNDGELGGVSVNGGESAASAAVWSAESGSITLTATPASGAEFLYWVGDVPYGQAKANPATIPANEPFSITAIFRTAEAATTRMWTGTSSAAGSWDDPSMWSPANIPGANDDVVVAQGYVLATNRIEVGSLTISGSGVVSVAAKLNWANRTQGVGNANMLTRYTGTRLGEAAFIVVGDVTVTNAGQLALGARNQKYRSTFRVGGDLILTGSPTQRGRLLIASGPTDETFTFAAGATPARIGGDFRIGTNGTAYVWSEQYTGGSVVIWTREFEVAAGGSVNAVEGGFYRFNDYSPVSWAPGIGEEYMIGGGYGGRGFGMQGGAVYLKDNYGKIYGFPYAPVHPGSPGGLDYRVKPAGGLIRVHAERAIVAGSLNARAAETDSTASASSGGGIWITSLRKPVFSPGASLSVKGGYRCTGVGMPGAGGRIAIGIGLTNAQIAEMAATGVLAGRNMEKYLVTDAFTADNPGVSVNVAAGEAIYAPSIGTFHVLDLRQAATVVLLH